MGSHRVVLRQPSFGFLTDLVDIHEDPGIKDAVAIATVEALDERVLSRQADSLQELICSSS